LCAVKEGNYFHFSQAAYPLYPIIPTKYHHVLSELFIVLAGRENSQISSFNANAVAAFAICARAHEIFLALPTVKTKSALAYIMLFIEKWLAWEKSMKLFLFIISICAVQYPAEADHWGISLHFGSHSPNYNQWESQWHDNDWPGDHTGYPYYNYDTSYSYAPFHQGYWHHGYHENRNGWWWVIGNEWNYYHAPVYPYPTITPRIYIGEAPAPAPLPPPIIISPPIAAAPVIPRLPTEEDPTLYYCRSANSYFPNVHECRGGWELQQGKLAR
jgi:hypothetical protein